MLASAWLCGHIGTSIAINSGKVLGRPAALDMSEEDDIKEIRERMMNTGGRCQKS
ncbi:MAG: hypothetical protein ACNYPE_16100 [Candidatus Azotimanducaceae bacterium WSBS_2022_MAG_OTU7]